MVCAGRRPCVWFAPTIRRSPSLCGEKIQVHPGDDVRRLITPYVAVIRQALDSKRVGEWKGYTADCRVRQVRRLLTHYFYFHEGCISEADFNLMVEDLLFVHKAG